MYTITRGMSRVLGKHSKYTCKNCQLTIPVYPGRYPRNCPHCREQLVSDPVDMDPVLESEVIEGLLSGKIDVDELIETGSTGPSSSGSSDRKKLALDKMMQKINIAGLLDQLIGVTVSNETENIWAYFSESVDEEKMNEFVKDLKEFALDVQLFPSEEEGSRWVVSVLNPGGREDPKVSGEMTTEIPITGDIDVTQ